MSEAAKKYLKIERAGTAGAYFTYGGKPVLSFGGSASDFIFYVAQDAFDYELWADWSTAHGMNHCRAYLPGSWTMIESFTERNGGDPADILFPFEQTEPGSRKFDVTRFHEPYWARFRKQCECLARHGIILDLLMSNGWQFWCYNEKVAKGNWDGHFYNPRNNVNAFTEPLGGEKPNRLKYYHSVADGNDALFQAQRAWFEKIVECTHDLGNIYYELVHELAENYADWDKTAQWLEAVALAIRARWDECEPDREILLGTDAGFLKGFPVCQGGGVPRDGSEMDWIFSRPYFNILIDGGKHHVANAREFPVKYQKPWIPQESWDDTGVPRNSCDPDQRVHLRKYVWKMVMGKVQQIDIYMKSKGAPHNYDPRGRNPWENDAVLVRQFWEGLRNFPDLRFQGYVAYGQIGHNYTLSSAEEAVVYVSSPTDIEARRYEGIALRIHELALPDGQYNALLFDPAEGEIEQREVRVRDGELRLRLPDFTDDFAVHVTRKPDD